MVSYKRHFLPGGLAVLLFTLGLRIFAVLNTDVIQRDGVNFIRMARQFSESPRAAMKLSHEHIGYPALIAVCHRIFSSHNSSASSWEATGQWISVLAGTAATLGVWAFAGQIVDWQLAWLAGLIFAMGRKWVSLGADVMSDAAALCMFIWAINFGLYALRPGIRRWPAAAWSAGAGFLAGLGFFFRPEAGGAAIVVCGVYLVWKLKRNLCSREWLLRTAACALAAGTIAGPYIFAMGGLTTKTHPGASYAANLAPNETSNAAAVAVAASFSSLLAAMSGPASDRGAGYALLSQTVEAMNPVSFGLLCLGAVSIAAHFLSFRHLRRPHLRLPRGPGLWAIAVTALLYIPVLLSVHVRAGYLDWRHCMILGMTLVPLTTLCFPAYAGFITDLFSFAGAMWCGRTVAARLTTLLWLIFVPAAVAGAAYHSFSPLHGGKAYVREAADLISRQTRPGETALTNVVWVQHYARIPVIVLDTSSMALGTLDNAITAASPAPAYLVLSDRWMPEIRSLPTDLTSGIRLELVQTFHQIDKEESDTVRVYRILRAAK